MVVRRCGGEGMKATVISEMIVMRTEGWRRVEGGGAGVRGA